ncbi:nuclease-related domain-containing protein [Paenisporosarcina antarctica]
MPDSLNVYFRLLQRIPVHHPLYVEIESRINRILVGYNGEAYVDYFLKNIEFPIRYAILKETNIWSSPRSMVQLDTLIITPNFICILEIKAIKDKIAF